MVGQWWVWPLYLAACALIWFGVPYFLRFTDWYWRRRGLRVIAVREMTWLFRVLVVLLLIFFVSTAITTAVR